MRDHRTLVVLCLMFGAMVLAPTATAQTASRQPSATQPSTTQPTATQANGARPAAGQAPAARTRPIPPQQQAQAALLTPITARAAVAGPGTSILPVAQTGGLSCVPYVRMATGMNVSGDARLWWHNAAATYARGQAPERGSVLAFMSSGGMSRGHVAVVSRVLNPRTIEIDHANWAGPGIRRGAVMRGVTVVDVSDRNDWTSVRVQVGHNADNFGRTYPTHGFIYNRPVGARTLMAAGEATREVAEAPMPHAALHLRYALDALAE